MFNPYVSNRNVILIYGAVWILIGLIHFTILFNVLQIDFEYAVWDSVIYNFLFAVVGLSLWFPSRYITFENYSVSRVLLNHFAAALLVTGIWLFAGYLILIFAVKVDKTGYDFIINTLLVRFVTGLMFYVIITSLNYTLIYYTNFREQVVKESKLNSLVKEAELKSLKYQINPHFIFNSLNSISSLTISNPTKAQEMTIKLSSFLRGTLSRNDNQKVKLKEEIQNIKLYLDIEKIRFEDKFDLVENVSDECKETQVPSMILQPIFENAIKHGVYESIENVVINVDCKKENDYLRIIVTNDYDPESVPRKGEGIGLKNIQNRLQLIYNQDNLLTYKKENNKFIVTLYIPL
ncbi:MAG: histidine kinase [Melioribacteraceae bacterium]|nr:histidine kinase [Melioribacteraceae bacterium]MCF8356492.1 histidine kinase [Melioribacteraceae bacterium]MCF8394855.1 histidine kinase [Melioribacteraceae bacterium]MCF8420583.1 histidine kinase [Melioribacteraceae bacterium]